MIGIREAAFVDDEARVHLAALDGAENAVVAQLDDLAQAGRRELQQPKRRRLSARDGHKAADGLCQRTQLARHHEWSDAMAQRGTAAQQPIPRADALQTSRH